MHTGVLASSGDAAHRSAAIVAGSCPPNASGNLCAAATQDSREEHPANVPSTCWTVSDPGSIAIAWANASSPSSLHPPSPRPRPGPACGHQAGDRGKDHHGRRNRFSDHRCVPPGLRGRCCPSRRYGSKRERRSHGGPETRVTSTTTSAVMDVTAGWTPGRSGSDAAGHQSRSVAGIRSVEWPQTERRC